MLHIKGIVSAYHLNESGTEAVEHILTFDDLTAIEALRMAGIAEPGLAELLEKIKRKRI